MTHAKPKKQDITRNILASEMRHTMRQFGGLISPGSRVVMFRCELMSSDARWFPPRKIETAAKKRRW